MGNKILGSKTSGRVPTISELGERELFVNLIDKTLHTSDGVSVFQMNEDVVIKSYSSAVAYPAGSIAMHSGSPVFALTNTTLGSFVPSEWKVLGTKEVGGRIFDRDAVYSVGDIVSKDDHTYIALVDHVSGDRWDDAAWQQAGMESVAKKWDPAYKYSEGDVISYNGAVFVSLQDKNTGSQPDSSHAWWHNVSESISYAGKFAPQAATEYPPVPAANSYYRVDGLAAPYTITAGDLAGTTVKNGDDIVYESGKWSYRPGQAIPSEKGGIAYDATVSYHKGDVVSDAGLVYVATQNSIKNTPSISPQYWTAADRGGESWRPTTSYTEGDVVTSGKHIHIAIHDHKSSITFASDSTKWITIGSSTAGSADFIGLSDTPSTINSGEIVIGNSTGNGLTFTDTINGGTY